MCNCAVTADGQGTANGSDGAAILYRCNPAGPLNLRIRNSKGARRDMYLRYSAGCRRLRCGATGAPVRQVARTPQWPSYETFDGHAVLRRE